jgi:transcriptional regulator
MHPNPAFRARTDPANTAQLYASLIAQVGFGMVFQTTPDGPRVAHTPLVLREGGRIAFHLARGNALARHLQTGPVDTGPALIVINGPDGYVSPRWYHDADQVPTWNYLALECEGPVRRLDRNGLIDLLATASAQHEARFDGPPWTMDKVSPPAMSRLLDAIVGFEMDVLAWRPTFKLSQNKRDDERMRVIEGLEAAGSSAIAALMRARIDQA